MAASKQQVKFYFPELSKIFPPTYFWPKIAWFHGCKEPRDMEDRPFFSSTKPSVSQNLVTCPHLREQSSCDSLKKKKKKKKQICFGEHTYLFPLSRGKIAQCWRINHEQIIENGITNIQES